MSERLLWYRQEARRAFYSPAFVTGMSLIKTHTALVKTKRLRSARRLVLLLVKLLSPLPAHSARRRSGFVHLFIQPRAARHQAGVLITPRPPPAPAPSRARRPPPALMNIITLSSPLASAPDNT
ncbi:hypothetical protein EVAR_48072_1 [Eumeta japonica]|uniref:Uncharacterized protein n=1 Tax=Eumeta variegata TaxID=151549 RepID=A0A4C1X5P5_EUMVA|nr:hypothetical protein EVAR_48072_1 [Eumeta japonica]